MLWLCMCVCMYVFRAIHNPNSSLCMYAKHGRGNVSIYIYVCVCMYVCISCHLQAKAYTNMACAAPREHRQTDRQQNRQADRQAGRQAVVCAASRMHESTCMQVHAYHTPHIIRTTNRTLFVPQTAHYPYHTPHIIRATHRTLFVPHTAHYSYHTPHTAHYSYHTPHTAHYSYHTPHTAHYSYHTPHRTLFVPHTTHRTLFIPLLWKISACRNTSHPQPFLDAYSLLELSRQPPIRLSSTLT